MSRNGGVYTPKTTVEFEKHVAEAWFNQYGMLSFNGKLRVVIHVYTDRTAKQDVDNLAKSVLDGLQRAGAFSDGDEQVWTLCVSKHAAKEDLCTMVTIAPLDE